MKKEVQKPNSQPTFSEYDLDMDNKITVIKVGEETGDIISYPHKALHRSMGVYNYNLNTADGYAGEYLRPFTIETYANISIYSSMISRIKYLATQTGYYATKDILETARVLPELFDCADTDRYLDELNPINLQDTTSERSIAFSSFAGSISKILEYSLPDGLACCIAESIKCWQLPAENPEVFDLVCRNIITTVISSLTPSIYQFAADYCNQLICMQNKMRPKQDIFWTLRHDIDYAIATLEENIVFMIERMFILEMGNFMNNDPASKKKFEDYSIKAALLEDLTVEED